MKRPLPASGRLGRIFLNTPACAPARCAKTAGQSRIIAVRNVAYRLGKGILAIRRLPTSMERTRLVVVRAPGKQPAGLATCNRQVRRASGASALFVRQIRNAAKAATSKL